MVATKNIFKQRLLQGELQIGLWVAMASGYSAEICATAGFDWLVLDAEHAPNTVTSLTNQLQALKGEYSQAVVRVPIGKTWIVKQVLDIGAQTLLVPMIETAQQAQKMVSAIHYPPRGVRGVGAALARASTFNQTKDYLKISDNEICLLLQIESTTGLDALEDIAKVDGVDGIFIGPADLAADMGYLGNPEAEAVQKAVEEGLARIHAAGKPSGILTSNQVLAKRYIELGARFVAVGSDIGVLTSGLSALSNSFRAHSEKCEAGFDKNIRKNK